MKKLVMAFSGPSNSGKTTLLCKLSSFFKEQGLSVALIKHDPGDKAQFDIQGKDSFNFFQSGAQTLVLSPTRTSYFSHKAMNVLESLKLLGDFDICLIEGLKELDFPRISVFCKNLDEDYFSYSNAVASYEKPTNSSLTWLYLDDIKAIASYILENAKKI